jgi:glutamate formiminotransferase / 5-formyltetrahydrofolate cyclo-ligase
VTTLLAVPNVSEGRDRTAIDAIASAFDARLLDLHSDPDHHRTVFTVAGEPGAIAESITNGAREAIARIDLRNHEGIHPRIGALDLAPVVYLTDDDRGAACAEALTLADRLGHELELPVFLYGALAGGRTRADIRRGGPEVLQKRLSRGDLKPDFGPPELHPSAGAVLVAARPPLVAFNVELAPPATLEDARAIAAAIREGGPEGLQCVRALGLWLAAKDRAQVSTNIEDHRKTTAADVVNAIARHARPAGAELVGLAPAAAFAGFPEDLPIENLATIEDRLAVGD